MAGCQGYHQKTYLQQRKCVKCPNNEFILLYMIYIYKKAVTTGGNTIAWRFPGFYFGGLSRKPCHCGALDRLVAGAIGARVALSTTSHHCGSSAEGSGAAGPGSHSFTRSQSPNPGGERLSADSITGGDFTERTYNERSVSAEEGELLALASYNLGSRTCWLGERMLPLLLSVALCLGAAVPQHVEGEWKSEQPSLTQFHRGRTTDACLRVTKWIESNMLE